MVSMYTLTCRLEALTHKHPPPPLPHTHSSLCAFVEKVWTRGMQREGEFPLLPPPSLIFFFGLSLQLSRYSSMEQSISIDSDPYQQSLISSYPSKSTSDFKTRIEKWCTSYIFLCLLFAYLLVKITTFYFKMRYNIAISINVGIYVARPNVQVGSCKYCIKLVVFIISWLSVSHAGIKPKKRLPSICFDRKVAPWPSLVHFFYWNYPYCFAVSS